MTNPAGTSVPREARDFGNFELVAKLATGGMAEIFLARRTDPVGRGDLVVIKRILPHLADDEHFVTMFRDEASLASKLEHPNVCRVFALGRSQDTWFIVMEYLHGVALSRMLSRMSKQKQMIDLRLVASIVIQACEGLHHAHELKGPDGSALGVVHRDVSPPNIFIGADGVVKLLDFGIAKARGASSKTRTGTVKGKNAYMSPEQILGKPLDRRSDVFALGAVMYELLAVKRLFHRESDFLTFKAITEEPIPDVRARRMDLPSALREVVNRALARDVNGRFTSAKEMADAVRAALVPLGGPASVNDVSRLILTDFAEELAAKQQLADQQPSGSINADASSLPSLSGTSGTHLAVAATVVDRPPRGNTLPQAVGELNAGTPRPQLGPPPLPVGAAKVTVTPAAGMVTPAPPSTQTERLPPAAQMVSPTGRMSPVDMDLLTGPGPTTDVSTDVSADLLGDRTRGFVIKACVGIILGATAITALVLFAGSGDKKDQAAVEPDAREHVDSVKPRLPVVQDAGPNKEDIAAIAKFGYFSLEADLETAIYIDGMYYGKTPLTRVPVPPGPHKVKAVGPKKKTRKFDITIFGGKDTDWGKIIW